MLIFKEIEQLARDVMKNGVTLSGLEANVTLDEQRLELLKQLILYTKGMAWLSHENLKEKVRVFLRCHYSYEQVAQKFNITLKDAQKSISYAGSQLRKQIGGMLPLIREGQLKEAERELAVATGKIDMSSMFVKGVTERFEPRKSSGVVLSDCRKELLFLSAFSKRNLENIVASVSEEKIHQLLYVLFCNSDTTYVRERAILWNCLVDGELNADECICALRTLNEEFIYNSPT